MTPEEDLKRAEAAVNLWQIAIRFHRNSSEDQLKKAKEGLQRAEEYRNDILHAIQEEHVHDELTFLPWLGDDCG